MVNKSDYPKCPKCGSDMKQFGTFLACVNYKITGCKGRADDPNRAEFIAKKKAREEASKESDSES